MLRRRGGGGELPTTFSQPSKVPDGSVKSIKLETPLAKAIRSADGFIKGTYVWLFVSLFFIGGGWTWIRRNTSSIVLDCQSVEGCTLSIQTPYSFVPRNSVDDGNKARGRSRRKAKVELKKEQIVRADNIKWDPESQVIVENFGLSSPTYRSHRRDEEEEEDVGEAPEEDSDKRPNSKKRKQPPKKYKQNKRNNSRIGLPDEDGNYESYVIILRDPTPPGFEDEIDPEESPSMRMARRMKAQHDFMANDPNSLANVLGPYAVPHDDPNNNKYASTEYIIHPRDFNIGQTRRLPRSTVAKVNAYANGRKSSFVVRESRPVAWQGLVLLILGIFSLVLCLLLGQFWEEHDPTKVGSYRKRMAELRKREEAKKQRLRRSAARKPPLKRPAGKQPSLRRPEGASSSSGLGVRTGSSVVRKPSTGSVRSRPNAGATAKNGTNGSGGSWAGTTGGVAKRKD